MQAGQTFIQTLLLQAMALYIHGPLRCKDLLGRIPNPHSRHALAAPQHAPGPRSDAPSSAAPPGIHTKTRHTPAGNQTPPRRYSSPAATSPPLGVLDTVHHTQTRTTSTSTPHSTKARPTTTPDRLFVLDDETGHTPGGHDQVHAHPVRRSTIAYLEPLFQTFLQHL